MVRLSNNFTLAEAIASDTAKRIGNSNQPTEAHLVNLKKTASHMEEVRALFGRSINPTSWYRNPVVNRAVGGVPTSHHALGWAVDFRVSGVSGLEAARRIRDSGIKFDQLIYYELTGIVHLSFHPQMRQQVRTNPTNNAGSRLKVGLPK
jgi:zinc D-Ala-D-Ala carboxypeptidase